ncbi:MAG TPA: secretin N-terminal domain-containing protein, partial [Burkholderiales bacterium]|nr:secretin N-terminal domain-containing protein [Burkholderiales bacterium]
MKRIVVLLGLIAVFAAGCAGQGVIGDSRKHFEEGRGEEALALLAAAMKREPDDHALRKEFFRLREVLLAQWLGQAESLRQANQFDAAAALYQRILRHDPSSARGRAGMAQVVTDQRHRAAEQDAQKLFSQGKLREAQDMLRPVLVENPQHRDARRLQRQIDDRLVTPAVTSVRLKTATGKLMSIELRDVTLRAMFDALSRTTGISFVLDKDVRTDQKASIAVRDQELEEVIRLILVTNQLEQKVLGETTVLVYPNTPQKQREYQELVVRTFYLANADVKQTASMIRTLVKTRDLFVDEKLNMLVIKDTPNAVRLAERLIAAHDLAEPEVMLEVEVLEIASNRLLDLGLRFPDSVAWSLVGGGTAIAAPGGGTAVTGGTPGVVSLPEWLNRSSALVRLAFTDPLFILSLRQQDGTTSVLANPRIRVKNKEKARIHIGDRVPVITTTAAATGGFVSESVSYLDVGLKLDVEPLVYLDDEVGIKVGLEVSNIVREIRSGTSNTLTYQIGTRNANTNLRLRDGETQILAGLISDEDRRTANRVPGLGDMPV